MAGEPTNNLSSEERLEAQKALGGEKIEKQLEKKAQAQKLEAEKERNKKIQEVEAQRAVERKEKLTKENKSWQKKVRTNKAAPTIKPPKKLAQISKTSDVEIPALRTFQDDVAKAIRNQKESVTTIALAEQRKQQFQKTAGYKSGLSEAYYSAFSIKKIVIGLGGLLILAALGGGIFSLLRTTGPATPGAGLPSNNFTYVSPIEIVNQNIVSTEPSSIPSTLREKIKNNINSDSFEEIIFINTATQSRINTEQFLHPWANSIPGSLSRNFENIFFTGIYSPVSSKNELAFIFNIQSHEQTLAGMLDWENTITSDFSVIYSATLPQTGRFQDIVFHNTDTRVLRDENNIIRIGYAIVGNTLVIGTGNASLNALIEAEPTF